MEEPTVTHKESVRFELVAPGTSRTAANRSEKPSPSRDTPLEIDSPEPTPISKPEIVTSSEPQMPEPDSQAHTTDSQSGAVQSSTSIAAGAKPAQSQESPEERITRITESPTELDPYVVKLAAHLAHQLQELRVPAIRSLTETVAMKIELQLLGNGALTRARVLKSTGITTIDEVAYRAALAASPYPQPPKDGGSQSRFEVELLFTPKRL
jgi:protein TonB